jgi:D-glycero-D-manno-heptose 1,7-bisphosphate phosphatase
MSPTQYAGRPAVFLDRDGVLNESVVLNGTPRPPKSVCDFHLCEGVEAACRLLVDAGLPLFVVTNQPDIARHKISTHDVASMNSLLMVRLPISEVAICPHDDEHECSCRKPKPGLLFDLALRHQIDLSKSVMVGDRWRDVAAGKAAGTSTVWIDRKYAEQQPTTWDLRCSELVDSVDWILERTGSNRASNRKCPSLTKAVTE